MTDTKTIRLLQSSQQFNLGRQAVVDDAVTTFGRGADFVGGTESGNAPHEVVLPQIAKQFGYHFHNAPGGGWLAHKIEHEHKDSNFVLTTPALPVPPRQGGHGPRGVLWLTCHVKGIGRVTVAEAHWLTGATTNMKRRKEHLEMTNVLSDIMKRHAKGDRLGFFMGDVNVEDEDNSRYANNWNEVVFQDKNLLTICDELKKWPPTHGDKTLDIIGSWQNDKRSKAKEVVAHRKQKKDHKDVSGFYTVKVN